MYATNISALIEVEKAARALVEGTYSEVVDRTGALVDALDALDQARTDIIASATAGLSPEYDPILDGFAYPFPSQAKATYEAAQAKASSVRLDGEPTDDAPEWSL